MACGVCGKGGGLFGGNYSFKCPVCQKEICKDCAHKYGDGKTYGGLLGGKHAEITCPSCHSVIKFR